MLVPLSWLNDYVDINVSADELEKKLFDCGFEVEEKWQVGKDISGIVVGYVESCEPIPETHLHVCQVNVGGPELLQICCGADNVKAGGKVPCSNGRCPGLCNCKRPCYHRRCSYDQKGQIKRL